MCFICIRLFFAIIIPVPTFSGIADGKAPPIIKSVWVSKCNQQTEITFRKTRQEAN